MSEPEKKSTPAKWDISNAQGGPEMRAMRLNRVLQQAQMFNEKIKAFELKAWTDPGPHTKGELDSLRKQAQELHREAEDFAADLKEEIRTSEEEIKSTQDEMRKDRGREYDLHKHVTTLSTASILGVAALTKLFQTSPEVKSAVAVSLFWFLAAIVLAIFAMAHVNLEIMSVGVRREMETRGKFIRFLRKAVSVWGTFCSIGDLSAFCIGLITIILFVIRSV